MARFYKQIVFALIDPHDVMKRLVRNPNYGGDPVIVPNACSIPLVERDMKPKFFRQLEDHVAKHGFRNPILVYLTPTGYHLQFGGSRLRVAKRLDIKIPAIVVDYTGRQQGETVTKDNWQSFFTDTPKQFEFTDYGIDTHYNLERARRENYDPGGFAWVDDVDDTSFIDEEFPWLNPD